MKRSLWRLLPFRNPKRNNTSRHHSQQLWTTPVAAVEESSLVSHALLVAAVAVEDTDVICHELQEYIVMKNIWKPYIYIYIYIYIYMYIYMCED
eukprot:gene2294-1434_t